MACPVCDHTMKSIALGQFWCPRCGTLDGAKTGPLRMGMEVPRLVHEARDLIESIGMDGQPDSWTGVAECCFKPEDRG